MTRATHTDREPTTRTGSLAEIKALLDERFDPATAEDWDSVGLISGDPDQPVRRVLFAVDPLPAVVEEAVDGDFDLIFTHHPLLLRPVQQVPASVAKGRVLRSLIGSDVALLNAHTNADQAIGGVADALADAVGLRETRPIRPIPDHDTCSVVVFAPEGSAPAVVAAMSAAGGGALGNYDSCAFRTPGVGQFRPLTGADPFIGRPGHLEQVDEQRIEMTVERQRLGAVLAAIRASHPYETPAISVTELLDQPGSRGIGRWGESPEETTLIGLARKLAAVLPATHHGIRVAGDPERRVRSVAVSGGSGDSLLGDVRGLPVDAFVTSDLRHHPATDHLAEGGCALLDIAHWAGEWLWLRGAAEQLVSDAIKSDIDLEVSVSKINTDPWSAQIAQQ